VKIESFPDAWLGRLFSGTAPDGEAIPLTSDAGWSSSFPEGAVVAALNMLAAKGWRVTNVSESSGIVASAQGTPESKPVAVRYLLERRSGADE
jgi:hypothetical protein